MPTMAFKENFLNWQSSPTKAKNLVRKKKMMSTLAAPILQCIGGSRQGNETNKRNRRCQDWGKKGKLIQTWHDLVNEKS